MPTPTRNLIGIVGAGMIGNNTALIAIMKGLGDIILFDIVEGMPQGKALDLSQMATAMSLDVNVTGTNDMKDLKRCDVVIVTAGMPRKPGMSRDDLLEVNKKIVRSVGKGIRENGTVPFCIVNTNPLDVMVMEFFDEVGFPPNMVVGMAGILDSSRFKFFLSKRLNVSTSDIRSQLIGGHGDAMVPLASHTSINGIPLKEYIGDGPGQLTQAELDAIWQRTRVGGGEILGLLKVGTAFNCPAAALCEMAKAYLFDESRSISCCCHLNGEYGWKDIYGGVPCIMSAKGVERIIELDLNEKEKAHFDESMAAVEKLRETCRKL